MKRLLVVAASLVLGACTSLKVVEMDPNTGYFPSRSKATTVTSKAVDLDSRKSLVVVPRQANFELGSLKNLNYFDEVITIDELEKRIVAANLADKVPSLTDRIGLSNAAKHFRPFLWFHYESRGSGRDRYGRFLLTDPATLDDYFVSETHLDYIWAGVNDQNNWYPMFNSLIDYIKANSKSYRK